MIEYMDGNSNPIVNTDYRAGGLFKANRTIAQGIDFNLRFGLGHESTHLGDEFTIFAQDAPDGEDFERINVSWEYWEVAGGLAFDRGAFRVGYIRVLGDDGFYSNHLLEGVANPRRIQASKRNYEPWIGGEYRWEWPPRWRYRLFTSGDLRFRTVYDYHRVSSDEGEEFQASYNVLVGLRPPEVVSGAQVLREIYFRVYYGVNPHGQFRTEKDYMFFGMGVRFGFDF